MKYSFQIPLFIGCLLFSILSFAEDGHENEKDHQAKTANSHDDEKEGDHDDHGPEKGNHTETATDKHGHEETSENSAIGLGKGIVSASEENGIKISPEAEKNFEIQKIRITSLEKIQISKLAVVTAGTEVNLYRYRAGHYKRIDFETLGKNEKQIIVRSKYLKPGDEIVVRGMALLRIAEIAAFGGAPEGHSH